MRFGTGAFQRERSGEGVLLLPDLRRCGDRKTTFGELSGRRAQERLAAGLFNDAERIRGGIQFDAQGGRLECFRGGPGGHGVGETRSGEAERKPFPPRKSTGPLLTLCNHFWKASLPFIAGGNAARTSPAAVLWRDDAVKTTAGKLRTLPLRHLQGMAEILSYSNREQDRRSARKRSSRIILSLRLRKLNG